MLIRLYPNNKKFPASRSQRGDKLTTSSILLPRHLAQLVHVIAPHKPVILYLNVNCT
jgi:hypothetical protein